MKTILETIQSGSEFLERQGIESARLNMEHLAAHVLECERLNLYVDFDRPLGEEVLAPLRELVKRRIAGEPLQHILGSVPFCGRDFKCDARALVPRPETEELVIMLLERAKEADPPMRILDMGSGTGVIGLTLAAEWREHGAKVALVDICPNALTLAQENAEELGLDAESVEFFESDLFAGLGERQFDLAVANLPYVEAGEIASLAPEVQRDPVKALDGGATGLEIVERCLRDAVGRVAPGGALVLEIGAGQSDAVTAHLKQSGWAGIEICRDIHGIERFLFANPAGDPEKTG